MVYFARKINYYSFCEKSSYERAKNDKIFCFSYTAKNVKIAEMM